MHALFLPLEACPDCITNLDPSDRSSVISCAATILVATIVRWLELRQLRKRDNKRKKDEKH